MTYSCYNCKKEFTPAHKPANLDRPFCSRSCSATYNNKHSPKRKVNKKCRQCGSKLNRSAKTYCSNRCQIDYKKDKLVSKWLETGQCNISSSPSHYVRSYILKEQQYKCSICSCDQVWNNKPLVFVLDHINGDSTNSSRSNLRMVCPNCDSQLPTYKGKNAGNGRYSRRKRYNNGQSY